MAKHGFIDESGTLPTQSVITVALILLEGAHSAEKLHKQIAKALYPQPRITGRAAQEKWYCKRILHFADMNKDQRLIMAKRLAKANLTVITVSQWHNEFSKLHDYRFRVYLSLVKEAIYHAFGQYDDLKISIEKQGGWQNYEYQFLKELDTVCNQFDKENRICKAKFFLSSAIKPGQKIADFYAGAIRDFILAKVDSRHIDAYEMIKHQITHLSVL